MADQGAFGFVRRGTTWSIIWGFGLIIFGMLAIGSPLLAAVAVNAAIAWLIVLAGVVHFFWPFTSMGPAA